MSASVLSRTRKVTMRTIAEHLDLSLTTVARSLKDGSRLSPATVERVRTAAVKLGYVRNLDGVRLRTGKTFVLMAFLSTAPDEEIGDSGSAGLLHGIHGRLAGTDYALRTVPVEHGQDSLPELVSMVRGRVADGFILDHTQPQDPRVRLFLESQVPFVTFGRTELFTPHAFCDIDNEQSAFEETQALLRRGARRIGLLNGKAEYTFVKQRLAGYRRALVEAGISFDPALCRNLSFDARAARMAGRELVSQLGADGLICVNDIVFFGARAGVLDLGTEVLAGIHFAFRAGTRIAGYLGVSVAASFYSRTQAGWHLADLLLRRIDGANVEDLQLIVRTELRDFPLK